MSTSAHWPIVICGVGCGILLLWTPNLKNRLTIGVGQGVMAATCLIVALARFSILPGLLMGLIGGALMTFGAVDRYTASEQIIG